jgi:hypothetical protein
MQSKQPKYFRVRPDLSRGGSGAAHNERYATDESASSHLDDQDFTTVTARILTARVDRDVTTSDFKDFTTQDLCPVSSGARHLKHWNFTASEFRVQGFEGTLARQEQHASL